MAILNVLLWPEYAHRPIQIWRRLRLRSRLARQQIRLAWDLPVETEPLSHIGEEIHHLGVYDRIVPEAICRLLDPGETAFDIGANIGQNLSIMALAAGPRGRAVGFEPSPRAVAILERNIGRWSDYDLAPMAVVRKGVSAASGTGRMYECVDLGGFSMEKEAPGPKTDSPAGIEGFEIELIALDDYVAADESIDVIKIDVEGHELSVLQGAQRLLRERQIRDIVFEDFNPQPSPVTDFLEDAGYTVFRTLSHWSKPGLVRLRESHTRRAPGVGPPNFLATIEPDRAISRFQARGWRCLHLRAQFR